MLSNRFFSVGFPDSAYGHTLMYIVAYLRLNGIKAREHPVFKELTRVKQYFDKIKDAETPVTKRENISIDKPAAGRILKAALVRFNIL